MAGCLGSKDLEELVGGRGEEFDGKACLETGAEAWGEGVKRIGVCVSCEDEAAAAGMEGVEDVEKLLLRAGTRCEKG